MPEIQLKNVRKVYHSGVYALDGVNLSIEQGDFVSVVGASGCGKTTLLKCIAGLESITAGELMVAGEIVNGTRVQERKVGIVFQEFTLYPNQSVFENIFSALRKEKMSYDEKVLLVKDMMEQMEISCISAQLPRELSYGQMQKVALARALIKNPEIILFDEPLSNIDEEKKREYRHLIIHTKQMFPDSTFIYVTHNLTEAFSMSNKLLVMDKGKVVQYGNVRHLFEYPNSILTLEALHQNVSYKDCVISKGQIVTKDESIELSKVQRTGMVGTEDKHAVCAKYDGYVTCFDKNGCAIVGVQDKVSIPVKVDAQDIWVLGKKYSSEIIAEGLLNHGDGIAVLSHQYFRFEDTPDSIRLEGTVLFCDDCYICCKCVSEEGTEVRVTIPCTEKYNVGENIVLYYPMKKLELFERDGRRMLSQYALTDNVIEAKVVSSRKGIVKIGKHKLKLNCILSKRTVKLQFSRTAFKFTSEKKHGLKISVLNEEYENGQTLVYAEIEGVQNYLVMSFEERIHSFMPGMNYVTVKMDQIHIIE